MTVTLYDGAPGRCEITWYRTDTEHSCVIGHADPTTWISTDFLYLLAYHPNDCCDKVSLTGGFGTDGHGGPGHQDADNTECGTLPGMVCFKDCVLRIVGDNRTVVYRVVRVVNVHTWLGVWPD
jgi:hypothetical protein